MNGKRYWIGNESVLTIFVIILKLNCSAILILFSIPIPKIVYSITKLVP